MKVAIERAGASRRARTGRSAAHVDRAWALDLALGRLLQRVTYTTSRDINRKAGAGESTGKHALLLLRPPVDGVVAWQCETCACQSGRGVRGARVDKGLGLQSLWQEGRSHRLGQRDFRFDVLGSALHSQRLLAQAA